jgi:hypothetical protein
MGVAPAADKEQRRSALVQACLDNLEKEHKRALARKVRACLGAPAFVGQAAAGAPAGSCNRVQRPRPVPVKLVKSAEGPAEGSLMVGDLAGDLLARAPTFRLPSAGPSTDFTNIICGAGPQNSVAAAGHPDHRPLLAAHSPGALTSPCRLPPAPRPRS